MACLQACLSQHKAYHVKLDAPPQRPHRGDSKTSRHVTWGQTQQ